MLSDFLLNVFKVVGRTEKTTNMKLNVIAVFFYFEHFFFFTVNVVVNDLDFIS